MGFFGLFNAQVTQHSRCAKLVIDRYLPKLGWARILLFHTAQGIDYLITEIDFGV